ncbi:hypothetical protein FBZ84_101164 [Azospirillum baldaniorum]|uniref:hypothetical protein n=1 Tax=Azospirillum baldaniorum TaxID=1064539 RepID=UPI0011A4492A|nr:hypothetical protein [Azospirillum baldaniorum]TWA71898.1 hypothetical protein FBZ84_101164 [Azospirillum baldaniorum]
MDPTPDAGQIAAVAGETITRVAGLSPAAQVVISAGLCIVAALWIWTRRPQPSGLGDETIKAVIVSLTEQAAATNRVAERVEQVLEQNATIIARLPRGSAPV